MGVTAALMCQVKLNRGLDFINLDDVLVDLKLTPDVLEIPVPRYFVEDRAKVTSRSLNSRHTHAHRHAIRSSTHTMASDTTHSL